MAGASDDAVLRLWQVETGQLLHAIQAHEGTIRSTDIHPNNQIAATGSDDRTIRLWRVKEGNRFITLTDHVDRVNAVRFSPDGNLLASGGGGVDLKVKIWDWRQGTLLRDLSGHNAGINAIAFTPDGKTVASASDDGTVILWNAANGVRMRTLKGHEGSTVLSIAIDASGKFLASGDSDGKINIWNLETGALFATIHQGTGQVRSLAFVGEQTLIGGEKYHSNLECVHRQAPQHDARSRPGRQCFGCERHGNFAGKR